MAWEIKSDYEHQRFYRKVLDELEDRWQKCREDYLNTHYEDPSSPFKSLQFDRASRNYRLVKARYERERFTRRWPH